MQKMLCFSLFVSLFISLVSPVFAQQADSTNGINERSRCANVYIEANSALDNALNEKEKYFNKMGHNHTHFFSYKREWQENVRNIQWDFSALVTDYIIKVAKKELYKDSELMKENFSQAYQNSLPVAAFFTQVTNFLSNKKELSKRLMLRDFTKVYYEQSGVYKKTTLYTTNPIVDYSNGKIKLCVIVKRKGIDKVRFPMVCGTFDTVQIAFLRHAMSEEHFYKEIKFVEHYMYQESEDGRGIYNLIFNGIDLLNSRNYVAEQLKQANCPLQ